LRSISTSKEQPDRCKNRLAGQALLRLLLTTTALIGLSAPGALAQQYWDGPNMTPGGVDNGRSGSGTWNGTNTNWTDQPGDNNSAWTGGHAIFAAVPPTATITVEGAQTFTGMTFLAPDTDTVSAYDFKAGAGGALVTNTPMTVITLERDGDSLRFADALFDIAVQGTGGIVKRGGGALHFYTANSYSGGTILENGRLSVYRTDGLGTGNVTVSGGLLNMLGGGGLQNTLGARQLTVGSLGAVTFFSRTDAGTATIDNSGTIHFENSSAAGGATITNRNGGTVAFWGNVGDASGATIVNEAGALINVSSTTGQLTIGSVSGGGTIRLGPNGLRVGSLGRDEEISGVIDEVVGGSGIVGLVKAGTGTLVLSGQNTYVGTTIAHEGRLAIDGSVSGGTDVSPTGILAGSGSIAGLVRVGAGGVLEGRPGQALTMGELRLYSVGGNDSIIDVALGAPSSVALFNVTGALTLDGRLNVSDAGGFTNGVYRLFDYGGVLTNNGLVITSLPAGHNPGDWSIDTGTAGQVDLLAIAGPGVQYWDGANTTPGNVANGRGGSGVWNASNTNWTNQAGTINAPWAGGTAVFAPQVGNYTVTVEGEQSFTGLRLLAAGGPMENITYLNAGAGGALAVAGSSATIETQAFRSAVIDTAIGGAGELIKTGSGEAVLARANTYSGGTRIEEGRLSVSQNGTLGTGPVTVAGGTLLFYGSVARDFSALDIANTGGTVQITAPDVVIGSLSGAGNVDLGSRILTIGDLGQNDVISGAITGTAQGQLIKAGSGTLTLAGINTYGGPTQAHEGRLVIDGSVAGHVNVNTTGILAGSGSIAGHVGIAANGILEGRSGQTLTMGSLNLNSIGGADSIVNVALGAPSSTALFNVTGNLTLDGTLNVTDAGGFGDGVYRIFDYGGTLTDNGLDVGSIPSGATGTVQTAIASQVNLVVGGSVGPGPIPTIQFWNGVTTAPTGTVAGGSGMWTGGPVTNWTDANGTRSDPWNGSFAVFQGAAGTVTVDAAGVSTTGMQFAVDGYRVEGGAITLSASGTIRVGDGSGSGAGHTATIASAIQGSGSLVKSDLGTLILAGDSSGYAGSVTVAAGDLRVGSGGVLGTSSLLVEGAGTLSGLGTVVGDVSVAGGWLAPGSDTLGTLTVAGNVTFGSASTFAVRIAAAGGNDALAATSADLGGEVAVTAIDPHASYVDGQAYTILTTTGAHGVNGAFDGAAMAGASAFLTPTLTHNADSVVLTIAVTQDFSTVAQTFNQVQAATALTGLAQSGDALTVFNAIAGMNAEEARRAFELSSGEVHAAGQHVLDQTFALFSRTLRHQGVAGLGAGSAGAPVFAAPLGYGPAAAAGSAGIVAIGEATDAAAAHARGAWAAPLGGFGQIGGDGNAARLDWGNAGLAGGYEGVIDVGSGTAMAGLGFGYIRGHGAIPDRLSTFDSDGFHLGAYGAWTDGAWTLAGSLAYGAAHVATEREIAFLGRTAEASYWTHGIGLSGEASYAVELTDGTRLAPLFTFDAGWSGHGGFTETGAGALNLTAAAQGWSRLDAGLGIALTHTILSGTGKVTLEGRAVWEHAYAEVAPSQALALAGSPAGFTVLGPDAGRDRLRLGAGISWQVSDAMSLRARYDGLFSGTQASHAAAVGLALGF